MYILLDTTHLTHPTTEYPTLANSLACLSIIRSFCHDHHPSPIIMMDRGGGRTRAPTRLPTERPTSCLLTSLGPSSGPDELAWTCRRSRLTACVPQQFGVPVSRNAPFSAAREFVENQLKRITRPKEIRLRRATPLLWDCNIREAPEARHLRKSRAVPPDKNPFFVFAHPKINET